MLTGILTVGICVVWITKNKSLSFIAFSPFLCSHPSFYSSILSPFFPPSVLPIFILIMFPFTTHSFLNFVLCYVFLPTFFRLDTPLVLSVFTIIIPFSFLRTSSFTVKHFSKFCWMWGEKYNAACQHTVYVSYCYF